MADVAHSTTSITGGHTNAVASGAAGFISGSDKAKLDGVTAGADPTIATLAAASSAVSVNGQQITNGADPTTATGYATKQYVDAVAEGLSVKPSVFAASTTNVATLTGAQTIDGQSATAGKRVALFGQVVATQNGLWIVQTTAWTRPTDFATGSSASGVFVFVENGTANGGSGWVCTSASGSDVVGTNNLTFTQFSGAGEITAGAGLSKSGNTLSVLSLDQLPTALADVNIGSHKMTAVTDPTSAQDAATKNYVDTKPTMFFEFRFTAFPATATVRQLVPGGAAAVLANGITTAYILIPYAMTVLGMRGLFVVANATDGATFTLMQGIGTGTISAAANGMSFSIPANSQTGSDTAPGHAQSYAAGDTLAVQFQSTGTTSTAVQGSVTVWFQPS